MVGELFQPAYRQRKLAGINLSHDEQAAIVTVIILAAGAFIRAKVTPVA